MSLPPWRHMPRLVNLLDLFGPFYSHLLWDPLPPKLGHGSLPSPPFSFSFLWLSSWPSFYSFHSSVKAFLQNSSQCWRSRHWEQLWLLAILCSFLLLGVHLFLKKKKWTRTHHWHAEYSRVLISQHPPHTLHCWTVFPAVSIPSRPYIIHASWSPATPHQGSPYLYSFHCSTFWPHRCNAYVFKSYFHT